MTPAQTQQLLITRAPDLPGITAARRDDENSYGPTVTLQDGGRAWWTITGTRPQGPGPTAGRLVPGPPWRTKPQDGKEPPSAWAGTAAGALDLTGQVDPRV